MAWGERARHHSRHGCVVMVRGGKVPSQPAARPVVPRHRHIYFVAVISAFWHFQGSLGLPPSKQRVKQIHPSARLFTCEMSATYCRSLILFTLIWHSCRGAGGRRSQE